MGGGAGGDTVEERRAALHGFLAAAGWAGITPVMLAGDASFRRYYRLTDAGRRAVLMDAPPPMEDVGPYHRRRRDIARPRAQRAGDLRRGPRSADFC